MSIWVNAERVEMSGANIRSIQALEDLKGALGRFGSEAQEALGGAQREIQRVLEWLGQRQQHWQTELRRRTEAARLAAAALARCQASGSYDSEGRYYPPNCTAYEAALAQTRAGLREAEIELRKVQQWTREVQRAVSDYQRQAGRLSGMLSGQLPRASALLGRKIASLQGYAAMSAPPAVWSPPLSGPRSGAASPRSGAAVTPGAAGGGAWHQPAMAGSDGEPSVRAANAGPDRIGTPPATADGIEDVPLEQIDVSDSQIHDLSDFHKVSYDEVVEGFRKLGDTVRPAVERGAGSDYFAQLDAERGIEYAHGYQRVYDSFYEHDAIRLERVGDSYQVINGYHRLFVAKQLGLEGVPARVVVAE